MSFLAKLADRLSGGTKSWSERPFWANLDRMPLMTTWGLKPDEERIGNDFESYVEHAYRAAGVVYACIAARTLVFSEARFQWRRFEKGRPTDLFGDDSLSILENPWPAGTTGELLARMEVDASLAGNFYATITDDDGRFGAAATGPGRRIVRMRPDWVSIIINAPSGDPYGLDAQIAAYQYRPPEMGQKKRSDAVLLLPSQVCHYVPPNQIDPLARYRGMSWLTPVLREIEGDKAATKHKLKFFENAATPNLAVSLPKEIKAAQFREFVEEMNALHKGVDHAYETLYTAGGADVTVIGADMKQLDFKNTQGAGETRIAMAARVPPVVLSSSEGMQGSSMNAGNYSSAKRSFADGTMRPLWRSAAASLQPLVAAPSGASLWYDERDVAFLRDDQKDVAEIQAKQSQAIRNAVDAGFKPDAAVRFAMNDDLTALLGQHSGLFSVQLQKPSTTTAQPSDPDAPEEGER